MLRPLSLWEKVRVRDFFHDPPMGRGSSEIA
jgi:hypothetical protein